MLKKGLFTACVLMIAAPVFAEDYTFLWWSDGWRGRAAEWHKTLYVQTNNYGAAIEVEKPSLPHLGPIPNARPYLEAVTESNASVESLPPSDLRLSVLVGGVEYRCVAAAGEQKDEANFPVRIIESGRCVQRADILNLVFANEKKERIEGDGRLEIVAEASRLRFLLEFAPKQTMQDVEIVASVTQDGTRSEGKRRCDVMEAGKRVAACVVWPPEDSSDAPEGLRVEAQNAPDGSALPVEWDASRGWYYVDLPERQWNIAEEPDRLDRFPVRITNSSANSKSCLLLFAFDGEGFQGITGLCPILRDAHGIPTGIPVQISKNWHRHKDRRFLYDGPWFHAFAEIPVDVGQTWEGELAITYARWGGVPSASHAQLCLVGWGVNQLWDEAAIGSWGESITYDPDVNLNRSMFDDVRPLMVTGMNGGRWEWTCNVGGGDFLVYFDANGKRQFLTRVRTAYACQGPNLTDVLYGGLTADGAIATRIEVSSPRCDDVNRAYHHIRYDVVADTPFSRLAFYQLGADHYNDHTFTAMARGNADGLVEEWTAERGGKRYLKTGLVCEGRAPWVSLHGGQRNEHHPKGAWANRGLIVRSWNARLDGRDAPIPYAAVFGTENGIPSANVELAPPPGIQALKKGDFVEADVELVIVPTREEDYYGPNEALRADLKEHADTWEPVRRLARGNAFDVRVTKGSLRKAYPPVVAVDADQQAEFELTEGLGYVPITIAGLKSSRPPAFLCDGKPVDQTCHGNDYWQAFFDAPSGSYSITYNVDLDSQNDTPAVHRFAVAVPR